MTIHASVSETSPRFTVPSGGRVNVHIRKYSQADITAAAASSQTAPFATISAPPLPMWVRTAGTQAHADRIEGGMADEVRRDPSPNASRPGLPHAVPKPARP